MQLRELSKCYKDNLNVITHEMICYNDSVNVMAVKWTNETFFNCYKDNVNVVTPDVIWAMQLLHANVNSLMQLWDLMKLLQWQCKCDNSPMQLWDCWNVSLLVSVRMGEQFELEKSRHLSPE